MECDKRANTAKGDIAIYYGGAVANLPHGSLRRRPLLTLVAVLALAIGLASCSSAAPSSQDKQAVDGILGNSGSGRTPATDAGGAAAASTTAPAGTPTTTPTTALPSTPAGSWSLAGAIPVAMNALSCLSPTACVAVGGTSTAAIFLTADAGGTWTQVAPPAGAPALNGVACPSASECLAVGGASVLTSTDGGAQWTSQALGNGTLAAISCPTAATCVAVGAIPPVSNAPCYSSGSSFVTSNGGASWAASTTTCTALTGVSCASTTACEASAIYYTGKNTTGDIEGTTDGATTWSSQYRTNGNSSTMLAISCVTTVTCEAVGTATIQGVLGTTDGHTWTHQAVGGSSGARSWRAISCTSTGCSAVGDADPIALPVLSGRWKQQTLPPGAGSMGGIVCQTTTCLAVGLSTTNAGASMTVAR
jgi:photosystem II stability/assembly factor-like uncharacterized protein